MEWIYRAPYAVPEMGIEVGDNVIVAPAADDPLVVIKKIDRNRLPMILEHLDRLTLLPCSGAGDPDSPALHLQRAVGCDLRPSLPLRLLP